MINKAQEMISDVANNIEYELSTKKVELDRTFNTSDVIEWTITTEDMCGCDISLVSHGADHYGIELKPFVYNHWGDPIYFPNRMNIDSGVSIVNWFRQNFIYEIHYVKNFRHITQNISSTAKDAGFDGITLTSKVNHGTDDRGIEFVTESFELEDTYNSVTKLIEVNVSAFKGKIVISTRGDGSWETISKDKDARKALNTFKKRMKKYIEQYNPHPRYYLMLLQDPNAFGEKVEVFPLNHTKTVD